MKNLIGYLLFVTVVIGCGKISSRSEVAADGSDYVKKANCRDLVIDRYVFPDFDGSPRVYYQAVISGDTAAALIANGILGSKNSSRNEVIYDQMVRMFNPSSSAIYWVGRYASGAEAHLTYLAGQSDEVDRVSLEIRNEPSNHVEFFNHCRNISL